VTRSYEELPPAEFASPGPLRDKLVAAILAGEKTSTTALVLDYERDREPLPEVGQHYAVVDSDGRPVAIIETTEIRVIRMDEVDEQFAREEGEGFESVADWRSAHERFWNGYIEEIRAYVGDPEWALGDDTAIVAERFRLVRDLG